MIYRAQYFWLFCIQHFGLLTLELKILFFYVTFTHLRHYVIGLSVHQSFTLSERPLSRWPNNPMTFCLSIHQSVQPEKFTGIFLRTHGRNSLKFSMLMHHNHLKNSSCWHHFDFVKLLKFDCNQSIISPEGGQHTSACQISGHFSHAFWSKALEIWNLTSSLTLMSL